MSSIYSVSQSVLRDELQQLCIQIRSDKQAVRNKAIDRFNHILSDRKSDVIDCVSNPEYVNTLNWTMLFHNSIEAVTKQAIKAEESKNLTNFSSIKNKNFVFSAVVNKVVDYAVEAKSPIKLSILLEAVSNGFENDIILEYFGSLLFQIIESGFIIIKGSIKGVKSSELSNLLLHCFHACNDRNDDQTLSLLSCINKILEIGTKYTQLCTDMFQFLPKVRNICNSVVDDKRIQQEIIKLTYHFVSNLVVDHHSHVCYFLQAVMPSMCGYYDFRLRPDVKEQLFELCAVCLNIHYLEIGNFTTIIPIKHEVGWNKMLKQFFNLVKTEIKEKSRQLNKEAGDFYCEKFLLLASSICYLIFWNPMVDEDAGESSRKKIAKLSNKYQGILDLAVSGAQKLSWGWFIILSDFIARYPELIEVSDYQPLLQTTVLFQRAATTSGQIKSIAKCCEILLQKDQQYKSHTFLQADFCSNQWKEIIDIALSNLLQKSLTSIDNQTLVQLLLKDKKISDDSVISLIRSLITNPIWRTDPCLETIKVAVKYYRNLIVVASEIVTGIILWLYPLGDQIDTKTIIHYKPIDPILMAEIVVLLITEENGRAIQEENVERKQLEKIDIIECALKFKYLKKLIFIESRKRIPKESFDANKSKLIVNDEYFKTLLKSIDFNPQSLFNKTQLDITDLINNMTKLEALLALLSTFLKHGTFEINDLLFSALIKKVIFLLNGIQYELANADVKLLQITIMKDLLHKISSFIEQLNEPDIANLAIETDYHRTVLFLVNCLNWFSNEDAMCNSDDMIFRRKISLECIKVLALLEMRENIFKHVNDFEINLELEDEIDATFVIIQKFCKRNQQLFIAEWIVRNIRDICKEHHNNMKISGEIIKLLPSITGYIVQFSHLTEDITIVLSSFLKKCYNKAYPPDFVIQVLSSIKNIAKIHHESILTNDSFMAIYLSVNKFMRSSSILVQYAAIECWSYLIDEKWFFDCRETMVDSNHVQFSEKLFDKLELRQFEDEKLSGVCCYSVCIQTLLSAFGLSFYLQETALLELVNFYFRHEDAKDMISQGLKEIEQFLGHELGLICKRNVTTIINAWLSSDFYQDKSPWFFFAPSEQIFYQQNANNIFFCALRNSKNSLPYIASKTESTDKQVGITSAIPLSVAFALPYYSDSSIDMPMYKTKVKRLLSNLSESHGRFELNLVPENKIWEILYLSISYLWDNEKFLKFCGFSLAWPKQEITFNYDEYVEGIRYFLSSKFKDQKVIIDGLMKHKSVQLVNLLSAIKSDLEVSYCIEAQLLSFFQYCTILHLIIESFSKEFWKDSLNNIRGYFIRDSIYYLCNILTNPKAELLILQAASHFVHEFFCFIMPLHSDLVGNYLNIITRALISLIMRKLSDTITKLCVDTLNFLVCQSSDILSKSIATLDDFPIHEQFKQSRENHEMIKYKNQSRSLLDEINYFLQVENRGVVGFKNLRKCLANKKDELITLLNHPNKTSSKVREGSVYKLLKILLNAIKSREDEIALEATKCLGELGPSNLTTIALFSDLCDSCYKQFHTTNESFDYFISLIIDALDNLLVTESHLKAAIANKICGHIINSRSGKKCIVQNKFLQPFLDNSEVNLGLSIPTVDIKFLEILTFVEEMSYSKWITEFTSTIYSSFKFKPVQELASIDIRFCEQTLVVFFKMLLATGNAIHISSIERLVNSFFEKTFNILCNSAGVSNCKIYTDKSTIKIFLNIAECIRMHNQISSSKLEINYLHIGKACAYCEAFFMAILYLEMWALTMKSSKTQSNQSLIANDHFQSIATEAFTSIGTLDAICGFLDPMKSRLDFLSLQNQWVTVLLELDAGLTTNASLYKKNLQRHGFYSLSGTVKCDKLDFETLWRLADWNLLTNDCRPSQSEIFETQTHLEESFQCYHYLALKSIKKLEEENVINSLKSARKAVMNILKIVSTECAQSMYKYITWLQILQQIDDFCEIQFPKPISSSDILQKWDYESKMEYGNFEFKELALSQKITLFNSAGVRAQRKINDFYKEENIVGRSLLNLIKECKSVGNKNLVIRNIAKLKNMNISQDLKTEVLIEDAEVNWKMGNLSLAKSILSHIVSREEFGLCIKKVDAFRIYGEYLAESNSESFDLIHKKFFEYSFILLQKFDENKDQIPYLQANKFLNFEKYSHESRKNIYKSIAKYADREYSQLNTYINSEEFQIKIQLMDKYKDEVKAMSEIKRQQPNRDEILTWNILRQNAGIDNYEIKFVEEKRIEYLILAIGSYMQCCILDSSIKQTEIFRLISLWFANKHVPQVLTKIKENIEYIPSYKFISVLHQITARLSSDEAEFNTLIQNLLIRCSIEHPYHTLPHVLAIANANKDPKSTSLQHSRITVAQNIVSIIQNHKESSEILKQMQQMSNALIEFANKELSGNTLTLNDSMRKLKNLHRVQCPTLEIAISPNKDYAITSIIKWKDKVTLVGGINAPKKIICLCSDGLERPQLLKGKDDMRQDAIMQQALSIINDMLQANKETLKRKLSIRTYKVVPLSMRSGILEWCENTIPIGSYLTGPKKEGGAHKKYYPKDFSAIKCSKLLMDNLKGKYEMRKAIYQEVCKNLNPVFHYFFFEKFPKPGNWFEKRLSYTNSIATTSMVGYILGLGDRHVHNILIDEITAEVIHIDFGIAFEQGKIMPTPETIPFRLTRDIIAPFGICGVDGIFRSSCEKTMDVLRENQTVLITILEVLLYDPLYSWILKTNTNTNSKQSEFVKDINKEEKNSTAQRALIRVKSKLMGMEQGGVGITSVEGQVQRLIKQAMNVDNLCQMFPGWSPHL